MNRNLAESEKKRIHPLVARAIVGFLILLLAPILAATIIRGAQSISAIQDFIANNSTWILCCCGISLLIMMVISVSVAMRVAKDARIRRDAVAEFSDRLRDYPDETKRGYLELANIVYGDKNASADTEKIDDLGEKLYGKRYFGSLLLDNIKDKIEAVEQADMENIGRFLEEAEESMGKYPTESGRMYLALLHDVESIGFYKHGKRDVELVCDYSRKIFGKVVIGKAAFERVWDSPKLQFYVISQMYKEATEKFPDETRKIVEELKKLVSSNDKLRRVHIWWRIQYESEVITVRHLSPAPSVIDELVNHLVDYTL